MSASAAERGSKAINDFSLATTDADRGKPSMIDNSPK